MENYDNFKFDDEEIVDDPQSQEPGSIFDGYGDDDHDDTTGNEDPQDDPEEYSDFIDAVLKARGIDRNNIEITNEDGTVESVSFDDLTDEEKAAILSEEAPEQQTEEEDQYEGITDDDLAILNYLKQNRIGSLQEFAEGVAKQAVDDYIVNHSNAPVSEIDELSDDEVIAYDLIKRFGSDMSDDEIDAEIARIRQDEEAYQKRVNLLRVSYKNEEEAQKQLYENEQTAKYEQDTNNFIAAYNQAAYNLNTIQDVDLDDEDKQAILDFALTKDQFGRTELSKALDDPEQVLKISWFLKYGDMVAAAKRDYFAQQLAKQREVLTKPAPKQPRAVTKPTSQPQSNSRKSAFKF